jgi:hypothetical protein
LRAANPERDRAWVRANAERVLGYKRGYRVRNADKLRVDARERGRAARATEEGAQRLREIVSAYTRRHSKKLSAAAKARRSVDPTKFRAREAVHNALKRGRLVRPDACVRCGRPSRKIHGHHEDYSKPLDVTWLCPRCHKTRHAEMEAAQ